MNQKPLKSSLRKSKQKTEEDSQNSYFSQNIGSPTTLTSSPSNASQYQNKSKQQKITFLINNNTTDSTQYSLMNSKQSKNTHNYSHIPEIYSKKEEKEENSIQLPQFPRNSQSEPSLYNIKKEAKKKENQRILNEKEFREKQQLLQEQKVHEVFNKIRNLFDKQEILKSIQQLHNREDRSMLIDKILERRLEIQEADQFVKLTQNAQLVNRFIRKVKPPAERLEKLNMERYQKNQNKVRKSYVVDSFKQLDQLSLSQKEQIDSCGGGGRDMRKKSNTAQVQSLKIPEVRTDFLSLSFVPKPKGKKKNLTDIRQKAECSIRERVQEEEELEFDIQEEQSKQIIYSRTENNTESECYDSDQSSLRNNSCSSASSSSSNQGRVKDSVLESEENLDIPGKIAHSGSVKVKVQGKFRQGIQKQRKNKHAFTSALDSPDCRRESMSIFTFDHDSNKKPLNLNSSQVSSQESLKIPETAEEISLKLLKSPLFLNQIKKEAKKRYTRIDIQQQMLEEEKNRLDFMKLYLQKSYWQNALSAFRHIGSQKPSPKKIEYQEHFVNQNGTTIKKIKRKHTLPSQGRDDQNQQKNITNLNIKKVSDKSDMLIKQGKEGQIEKATCLLKDIQIKGLASHFNCKVSSGNGNGNGSSNSKSPRMAIGQQKKEEIQRINQQNTFQKALCRRKRMQKNNPYNGNQKETVSFGFHEKKRQIQSVVEEDVANFIDKLGWNSSTDSFFQSYTKNILDIDNNAKQRLFKNNTNPKERDPLGLSKNNNNRKIGDISTSKLEPNMSLFNYYEYGDLNPYMEKGNDSTVQSLRPINRANRHLKHVKLPKNKINSLDKSEKIISLQHTLEDDNLNNGNEGNNSFASYTEIKLDQLYTDSKDIDKKINYLNDIYKCNTTRDKSESSIGIRKRMNTTFTNRINTQNRIEEAYQRQTDNKTKHQKMIHSTVKRKLYGLSIQENTVMKQPVGKS